jgi:phosphotransferase system enzyme I (PtsP)
MLDHVLDNRNRVRLGAGIVLAKRIAPSLVIELKTEGAQALLTERGSATSHGVILARAMGIPVVTGIAGVLSSVRRGDQLIVDGTTGVVVARPEQETLHHYQDELQRAKHVRTEHHKFRGQLARTADGVRITLQANVGLASDLSIARENGAEGIGLYRTEFPFIVRGTFPTIMEQVKIYRKAYELFPNGPITFRILDLGADKFVVGEKFAAARNAFHGYRSIRVLFDHPDVLRDQVQALALATGQRTLRLLIPMVSSMEELRRVKDMISQAIASIDDPSACKEHQVGVMIEVPAAVEIAADIAREADFLSIGTNDLMQYTLVVDREDARMAPLSDPYHPAVLRVIGRVAAAARDQGKPISVCGEIATRPDLALAMMALGIDSFSVVPTAIPGLKQAFANMRLEPMQRQIQQILRLSESRSVSAALREVQKA